MAYNPNIHDRRSSRLKGYDYSQAGLYFITICSDQKKHLFGTIVEGEMYLNDAGKFANQCWLDIPMHFPNAVLHEHIVMPNHVHGIIELVSHETGAVNSNRSLNENYRPLTQRNSNKHAFQKMIPRSIGSIVKGFKIGVTKWFRNYTDIEKVWQRKYHEHIILNETSYYAISTYIAQNPQKWDNDDFYS